MSWLEHLSGTYELAPAITPRPLSRYGDIEEREDYTDRQ